jgi:DNA-directed RNA polymerase subunit RPC12/RpoP
MPPRRIFAASSKFSATVCAAGFFQTEHAMVAYVCKQCGMSIGTMTCGKCGKELRHSSLEKADGSTVHISECPDGHGKVKSPMCCGQDMTCPI